MLGKNIISFSLCISTPPPILVAPMCFVFEDPVHLYFIFRQFYMKYFFNLHHISASPNVRKSRVIVRV